MLLPSEKKLLIHRNVMKLMKAWQKMFLSQMNRFHFPKQMGDVFVWNG